MAKGQSRIKNDERLRHIQRLAETELPVVAAQLGLTVVGTGNRAKILCPFHADKDPSLKFYVPPGNNAWRYKCFACGATGDVFDLVKEIRNCDFRGAIDWLSGVTGIAAPDFTTKNSGFERTEATSLEVVASSYQQMTALESRELDVWAKDRNFTRTLLVKSDVFFARSNKLSTTYANDRETLDLLEETGLVVRRPNRGSNDHNTLPIDVPPVDFFWNERVVFILRDHLNRAVAFAARATRPSDEPKYLFSRGFKKRDFLYGLCSLSKTLEKVGNKKGKSEVVFIVEGLTDVLRLRSLGYGAVGVLGSEIGAGQVELLTEFAKQNTRGNTGLTLLLYLDADTAGWTGTIRSLRRLLKGVARDALFSIEVICPAIFEGGGSSSSDPDDQLSALNKASADQQLAKWRFPVPTVLLAAGFDCRPEDVNAAWSRASTSERGNVLRKVDQHLSTEEWKAVFDIFGDDFFQLDDSSPGITITLSEWQARLKSYLLRSREASPQPEAVSDSEASRLLRAIQLAQSSTQRREAPTDELSWQRLLTGVHVVLPYLTSRLRYRRPPLEPFLAVQIPKSSGGMRLKALPCPEDLACQQYLLNGLLLSHPLDAPGFMELVPAVRYESETGLMTTGPDSLRPDRVANGQKVASFAYQVDMDVLNGVTEPRGDGLFRPYIECWSSFIDHISQSVIKATMKTETYQTFYVSRLDVRSYYDMLPRFAVNDVLGHALADAVNRLSDPTNFVPLFDPSLKSLPDRTNSFIDYLCRQSFGYQYYDPSDGTARSSPFGVDRGLPQGPDLSAYIATIALFPLDRRIVEEVANSPTAVAYARYVDDMVLVTTSAEELERLRGVVQFELRKIGLELSPKTDPLPKMSGNGVLNWLTEKRGGLGVSGLDFGPPITLPALSDDGGVDRREALVALGEIDLYRESADVANICELLRNVRSCPDLRFNDKCRIATLVWRLVATDLDQHVSDTQTQHSGEKFAEVFIREWKKTFTGPKSIDHSKLREEEVLSVLFGLERFLCSMRFLAPDFSDVEKRAIYRWRQSVAMAVHSGMLKTLREKLPNTSQTQAAILDVTIANLHVIASQITPPSEPSGEVSWLIEQTSACPPALIRSLLSLASAQKSTSILEILQSQPDTSSHLLMHEAMVRLAAPWQRDAADPLQSMTQRLTADRGSVDATEESLLHALKWWLPDNGVSPSNEPLSTEPFDIDCSAVLAALLNVGHLNAARLLQRRAQLVKKSLNFEVGEACDWLPVIPVDHVPGFVGFQGNSAVLRLLFCDLTRAMPPMNDISFSPLALEFTQILNTKMRRALFDSTRRIQTTSDPNKVFNTANITQWIAHAYESIVTLSRYGSGMECPPFAGNLVGPSPGESLDEPVQVVGFLLAADKFNGQAFIREPNSGLIPHGVNQSCDYLWRTGYAIADLLGLADRSTNLPSATFDSPYFGGDVKSSLGVTEDRWAIETLLKFSLFRLCGKVPSRIASLRPSDNPIPPGIRRVLDRLKQFPNEVSSANAANKVALVLSTVVETRFAAVRAESGNQLDSTRRGGPCATLAHMLPHRLPSDSRFAQILPKIAAREFMPKRRSTRAWYLFSRRLSALKDRVNHETDQRPDEALVATVAGVRLVALEVQLRAQVLELIAMNATSGIERISIADLKFNLEEWGLDGTELLHELGDDSVDESDSEMVQADRGVLFLCRAVEIATNKENGRGWHKLSQITPLGWVVLLGVYLRSIRSSLRTKAFLSAEKSQEINDFLRDLAIDLAVASDPEGLVEPPWGDLSEAINLWTDERVAGVLKRLDAIDEATGVVVKADCESPVFAFHSAAKRADVEGDSGVDVTLPDGNRFLRTWQVVCASAAGERSTDGVERFLGIDDRYVCRWSQTTYEGRVIAVHVAQPRLANLAGMLSPPEIGSSGQPEPRKDQGHSSPDHIVHSEVAIERSGADSAAVNDDISEESLLGSDPVGLKQTDLEHIQDFRRTQESVWSARSERAQCYLRVALVQWQIEEEGSYAHPIFEVDKCSLRKISSKLSDGKKTIHPEEWSNVRAQNNPNLSSAVEYRRRQILKETFRACKAFKVDCLLLPEYSTRPETVEWIKRTLQELRLDTIVWAGTFRYPPFTPKEHFSWLSDVPEWAAVAPVAMRNKEKLFGSESNVILQRMKKYPSVAHNEMFATYSEVIKKLIPDGPELPSRIIELICSEIFLATSPSNLLTLAISWNDLASRFGSPRHSLLETLEFVLQDVKQFALATSLAGHPKARRSVLFVPAMTPRAQDYVILGQANYLASGMTTVFCNDSGRHGHGQSCFIGHNGWDNEKDEVLPGIPLPGPYSGVLPGIFRPRMQDRGWLQTTEQAMVIADIDPTYQTEGKPRPQNLLPPLQLVAHLPILEVGSGRYRHLPQPEIESSLKGIETPKIRGLMDDLSRVDASDRSKVLHGAMLMCAEVLSCVTKVSSISDNSPSAVADCLRLLAAAAPENKHWLLRRADSYKNEHAANPQRSPPATLTDWLHVDLSNPKDPPTIHAPPYTKHDSRSK